MQEGYYNYYTRLAESWWERRDFVRGWRRLHGSDRRWVPPYLPKLMAALAPNRAPHVDRQHPALFWVEALQGKPNTNGNWSAQRFNSVFMEEAVAVAALLADPRRNDETATHAARVGRAHRSGWGAAPLATSGHRASVVGRRYDHGPRPALAQPEHWPDSRRFCGSNFSTDARSEATPTLRPLWDRVTDVTHRDRRHPWRHCQQDAGDPRSTCVT